MTEFFMKKFALTKKGTQDMITAIASVTVSNIVLMLPVGLLYSFTEDYLNSNITEDKTLFYIIMSILCLFIIYITNFWQYNATFFATYRESGKRRINLAEKLRKLPLSFFAVLYPLYPDLPDTGHRIRPRLWPAILLSH